MLILASASPRRHELLLAAGIAHIVRPTSLPESWQEGELPEYFVRRLALEKAQACSRSPGETVLAADTTVCVDKQVLGKPQDETDARRMLRLLSNRSHWVYTGICLVNDRSCIVDLASTEVTFASLGEEEIAEYTQSGEPADKAGAYAIQGLASKFVVSVRGSYSNVVGLPISLVYSHLKDLS
jgi:nucleoside triphosphate pyrophosphatase